MKGCLRGLVVLVILGIGAAVIGSVMNSRPSGTTPAAVAAKAQPAPVATIDKSAAMQADRKEAH